MNINSLINICCFRHLPFLGILQLFPMGIAAIRCKLFAFLPSSKIYTPSLQKGWWWMKPIRGIPPTQSLAILPIAREEVKFSSQLC